MTFSLPYAFPTPYDPTWHKSEKKCKSPLRVYRLPREPSPFYQPAVTVSFNMSPTTKTRNQVVAHAFVYTSAIGRSCPGLQISGGTGIVTNAAGLRTSLRKKKKKKSSIDYGCPLYVRAPRRAGPNRAERLCFPVTSFFSYFSGVRVAVRTWCGGDTPRCILCFFRWGRTNV